MSTGCRTDLYPSSPHTPRPTAYHIWNLHGNFRCLCSIGKSVIQPTYAALVTVSYTKLRLSGMYRSRCCDELVGMQLHSKDMVTVSRRLFVCLDSANANHSLDH